MSEKIGAASESEPEPELEPVPAPANREQRSSFIIFQAKIKNAKKKADKK